MTGSEAGVPGAISGWSVLASEALLHLELPAGFSNRLSLGPGPKLLALVSGLLSPATYCPFAFLGGFGFLELTSQGPHLHKTLLTPATDAVCAHSAEVQLIFPFNC